MMISGYGSYCTSWTYYSLKIIEKDLNSLNIVIAGAGAAGTAVTKLLLEYGFKNIVVTDSKGIINKKRELDNPFKEELAILTNELQIDGLLSDALEGADIFIGLSKPNIINQRRCPINE
jgi:malate dehydrogenase (oxaloacetate-decarboxylating)